MRIFGRVGCDGVALADDTPALNPATAERDREAAAPVIAASLLRDFRRAAKFTGDDDHRLAEQAAVAEIAEERGHRGVQLRQQIVLQRGELVEVRVPVAVFDGHAAHARLDETTRHDAALAHRRAAVRVAQFFRLGVDVECALRLGRSHQRGRALREDAEFTRAHVRPLLDAALKTIHLREQPAAVRDALRVHLEWRQEIGHLEARRIRIRLDHERHRTWPEIRGACTVVHRRQAHIRRHAAARPELVRDHGAHGRMLVVRLQPAVERRVRMIAGEHVVIRRTVAGVAVREAADERKLVHHARKLRQVLADADARHLRPHFLKRTAHRVGRVGLHVERVNRAESAAQE